MPAGDLTETGTATTTMSDGRQPGIPFRRFLALPAGSDISITCGTASFAKNTPLPASRRLSRPVVLVALKSGRDAMQVLLPTQPPAMRLARGFFSCRFFPEQFGEPLGGVLPGKR